MWSRAEQRSLFTSLSFGNSKYTVTVYETKKMSMQVFTNFHCFQQHLMWDFVPVITRCWWELQKLPSEPLSQVSSSLIHVCINSRLQMMAERFKYYCCLSAKAKIVLGFINNCSIHSRAMTNVLRFKYLCSNYIHDTYVYIYAVCLIQSLCISRISSDI